MVIVVRVRFSASQLGTFYRVCTTFLALLVNVEYVKWENIFKKSVSCRSILKKSKKKDKKSHKRNKRKEKKNTCWCLPALGPKVKLDLTRENASTPTLTPRIMRLLWLSPLSSQSLQARLRQKNNEEQFESIVASQAPSEE
ncbi:uncharacterized protein [Montipora foliosa]|uniref:uncharacterized protein isoform X2 n=1 Tax=Montipora foliosa TaxID=591990 RepID=UPI0035F1A11E